MFTPGFRGSKSDSVRPGPGGSAGDADGGWPSRHQYGDGDGNAGKGPVRGFPPAPGQPSPLYPPGQFSAWNQHGDDQAGAADAYPYGAWSRRAEIGLPAAPGGSPAEPPGGAAPGEPPLSRYYAQDSRATAVPGYPVLAVSDPAADVTSTQTWRAIAEGRSTGIWSAPPELRDAGKPPPAGPVVSGRGAQARPRSGPNTSPGTGSRSGQNALPRIGSRSGPNTSPGIGSRTGPNTSPGIGSRSRPGAASRSGPTTSPGIGSRSGPNISPGVGSRSGPNTSPGIGSRSGPHTGPQPAARRRYMAGIGDRPGLARAPIRRRVASRSGRGPSRPLPGSVRLAITVAILLIVGASSALGYYVVHNLHKARSEAAQSTNRTSPSASPSPSPNPGPYGHIASRKADPQPLTLAQLFPPRFVIGTASVTRTATSIGRDCTSEITGSALQEAVNGASCTQLARATYLDGAGKMMGTIGVLNLSTAAVAKGVVQSADANNFISQLTAASGPTHSIGQGTGIEEAAAKGHYLILIWAEFTTLKKPANAQQSAAIENFMKQLLDNTANVSLTARMLSGTP